LLHKDRWGRGKRRRQEDKKEVAAVEGGKAQLEIASKKTLEAGCIIQYKSDQRRSEGKANEDPGLPL